jgi:hypothetical protein
MRVLLAAAGSAKKSFVRLMHTPMGYEPHNVFAGLALALAAVGLASVATARRNCGSIRGLFGSDG